MAANNSPPAAISKMLFLITFREKTDFHKTQISFDLCSEKKERIFHFEELENAISRKRRFREMGDLARSFASRCCFDF